MPPAKRPRNTPAEDMSEYKDAKGVVYEIQKGYTTGEVVILSDDLAAWKVQRSVLTENSPVFRDMFAGGTADNTGEIHLPDSTRAELDRFLHILCGKSPPLDLHIPECSKSIDLLCRYDCTAAARRLLYTSVEQLHPGDMLDAFALASRLDDTMTGCRILGQGWIWYRNGGVCEGYHLDPFDRLNAWGPEQAKLLQPTWLWALGVASTTQADRVSTGAYAAGVSSRQYWSDFTGIFLLSLMQ